MTRNAGGSSSGLGQTAFKHVLHGVWLTGCLGRLGQHLPDRGQAANAHRQCRSCERPAAGSRPSCYTHRRHHLPDRGQAADDTSAIVWLTGCLEPRGREWRLDQRAAIPAGQHLADRGQAATRCLTDFEA